MCLSPHFLQLNSDLNTLLKWRLQGIEMAARSFLSVCVCEGRVRLGIFPAGEISVNEMDSQMMIYVFFCIPKLKDSGNIAMSLASVRKHFHARSITEKP